MSLPFVTLTCPSCGGKLQVAGNQGQFACPYCGATHILQRSDTAQPVQPTQSIPTHSGRVTIPATQEQLRAQIAQLTTQLHAHLQRQPKRSLIGNSAFVLTLSLFILSVPIIFMIGSWWLLIFIGIGGVLLGALWAPSEAYRTHEEVTKTIKANLHHREAQLQRLENSIPDAILSK